MEKEKEFRTKFQSQQKTHSDSVDSLQVCTFRAWARLLIPSLSQAEIRNLRKQLSQSSHKSAGSVSAKGSGSTAKTGSSAHASLAAALTSGGAST